MFESRGLSAQLAVPPAVVAAEQLEHASRLSARHSSVFLTVEAALRSVRSMTLAKGLPPLTIERAEVEVLHPGSRSPIIGHQIIVHDAQGRSLSIRSATHGTVEFGVDAELGVAAIAAYSFHSWKADPMASTVPFDVSLVLAVLKQWLSATN